MKANFATEGPAGQRPTEHRGHRPRHRRRPDRTVGDHGVDRTTSTRVGYWTVDDYEALHGPGRLPLPRPDASATRPRPRGRRRSTTACCRPSTRRSTPPSPRTTSTTCPAPCSNPTRPIGAPTPRTPTGRRPFGRWAWDGSLFGATLSGPGDHPDRRHLRLRLRAPPGPAPAGHLRRVPDRLLLFERLQRRLRELTGLASRAHRDQGILSYEFMIDQRPERPVLVVGELSAALDRHRRGSAATRRRARAPHPTPGGWRRRTRSCSSRWWRSALTGP